MGAGGEPISLPRTLSSHGVALLPPNAVTDPPRQLTTTLALATGRAVTVLVHEQSPGVARVEVGESNSQLRQLEVAYLLGVVRRMLRLDEDLSRFYSLTLGDPRLAWVSTGAGRMLRSPTVFEDVVKTICTTNCSWSATERMVGALVTGLGIPDIDGRRSFPRPLEMARAPEGFYKDIARAGYRGTYLLQLAQSVVNGVVDLEALLDPDLPDSEAEARLMTLPGVGPYAAAHIMLTGLGRYGLLVLDSWTRPTYARLIGRRAPDAAIRRAFRRYREYGGLAFWLYLTRDWVEE